MILLTLLSLVGLLGKPAIRDGYIDRLSAFPGDSVTIYIDADTATSLNLELYDLNGKVVAEFPVQVFTQAEPAENAYENGYQYKPTTRIKVPEIPSGIYLWNNSIPMVVKNRSAKVVVLYSSNTENAYSPSGGKSLYDFNSLESKKAVKVSFRRPIALPRHSEAFLRWIVRQPVADVGYITDMDMDDYNEIRKASLLIIPGHSEYWTLAARQNFDRFVEDGKSALVLSGNTMWWQVRYSEGLDQMICYKSAEDDKIKSPQLKTTRWNDPTLGYPITKSIGVEFPLAGYGRKTDKGWDGYRLMAQSPLLENTSLVKGDTLTLFTDEHDGAPLLGFNNDSIPVINRQALGFEKVEIVGYDRTTWSGADGVATWIVFKASKKSGIVINTASTDWCSDNGIAFNEDIQIITMNMIKKLLRKENVFSPDVGKESMPLLSN
jgi:hypothetical protein